MIRNLSVPTAALPMVLLLTLLGTVSCGAFAGPVREDPHPLIDMEEPLALFQEPADEPARQSLPSGSYSGVYVVDAKSLDDLDDEGVGVEVQRVVENSPGDLAGLKVGDVLFAISHGSGPHTEIEHASQWRKIELDTQAGTMLSVFYDRANREMRTMLTFVPRVRAPERHALERFREEEKVGLVVRTATEVEARRYELGPGAGAVVVGLSRKSPWRAVGIGFGDVILSVDGRDVTHPQVVLEALRAQSRDEVSLVLGRSGERVEVDAAMTRRESEVDDIYIPLLYSYENQRGAMSWSFLLSIFQYESTDVSWRFKLLWLIRFGGGDADELIEEGGR